MARSRMRRQVVQDRARLLHTAFRISLAQDAPHARLVRSGSERKLAGGLAEPLFLQPDDAPARQRPRELGYVGLRVAGADAQRVQLHDLASEVLVQTAE